jgi:hypothetical protein
MTSAINYTAIITTFPVAGKDNDSQGFRDNFTATSVGLQTAKSEITDLQSKALLSASLGANPTTVTNDLLGSTISNGVYNQFYGKVYTSTVTGTANVDLHNGPFQKLSLNSVTQGNTVLNFTNWPTAGQWGVIRIMLLGNVSNSYTVNFTTANSGTVHPSTGPTTATSLPLTVTANQVVTVEAWSIDSGTNVYIKTTGTY